MKKKWLILAGAAALSGVAAAYVKWQNHALVASRLVFRNPKLPAAFEGFKIAQVSDIHNNMFGPEQRELLGAIQRFKPDIIVATGDLIDKRHPDIDLAEVFFRHAVTIAPVYFSPGNHEAQSGKYAELRSRLTGYGVQVLDNGRDVLYRDGAVIEIAGVLDPAFEAYVEDYDRNAAVMRRYLRQTLPDKSSNLRILLSHRPELLPVYAEFGVDLVFSGHAHGGQWRIPGIGGVFAPHQGLFPKITSGIHTFKKTTMVVSRGLGNSAFPIRICNRPELVLLTLMQT